MLLVGGELDFTTPPQVAARELLPHLPNGHQVVLPGFGHTVSFWTEQPRASTRLLNAFLDEGKVDTSLYTPMKVDFTPEVTQTALGKGFAGTMLGLPALVVLSLLLLWWRSRRRGRIGRKSSIMLRSLFTIVLGLGGWFAGLTVALLAFPTLPLDNALLAVLSIGLPIGLGVYWAWLDRRRTRGAMGFSAAVGGALVGAFVGFQVGAGLLAVVTTIVGAAVGANLAVLVLDIWGRPGPRAGHGAAAGDRGLIAGHSPGGDHTYGVVVVTGMKPSRSRIGRLSSEASISR